MSQLSKQSDSSFFSHINNWTQCSLVFKLWQWPSVTLEINNTHKRGRPRMKERKNRVYVCVCLGGGCIRSIRLTCWCSALLLHFSVLFAYGAIYASIKVSSMHSVWIVMGWVYQHDCTSYLCVWTIGEVCGGCCSNYRNIPTFLFYLFIFL